MQQKFCHLQRLSTHKGNNNYHCVQSNKSRGTVYQTGMPSPALLFRYLFCVIKLLYQLPSLSFLFSAVICAISPGVSSKSKMS